MICGLIYLRRLERTPFLELEGWQWQKEYETAVKNMLDSVRYFMSIVTDVR